MSTAFRFTDTVTEKQFRDAVRSIDGLSEEVTKDTTMTRFCITNGDNYVWTYVYEGNVSFETYGMQAGPGGDILDSIAEVLDTSVLSEHDEGFFE